MTDATPVDPVDGSRFRDDWLSRREAVDRRSRAHGLARFVAQYLATRTGPAGASVVDLGAGHGANRRYLRPRLGGAIRWRLLDQDRDLLTAAMRQTDPHTGDEHTAELVDLAGPLVPLLDGADLVTASALLDLVSSEWIEHFVDACAGARAAILVALSVDGRIEFSETDPLDDLVRRAIARDQARDKGLGLALGGAAPAALINALSRHGYAVTAQPSDWRIEAADAELARALIQGWRQAAARQSPSQATCIGAWAERRIRAIKQGRTGLRVGHVDILGLPGRVL